METVFSLSEAKSKFSDIINRIIYKREKILITKKRKKVAVILPIDELEKENQQEGNMLTRLRSFK